MSGHHPAVLRGRPCALLAELAARIAVAAFKLAYAAESAEQQLVASSRQRKPRESRFRPHSARPARTK